MIMKTSEQNKKEVMTYLQKSAQHFFESEDGNHWQAVVYLTRLEKYVFIKDGEVIPINLGYYTGEADTYGKSLLKRKLHPNWSIASNSMWYKGYGHDINKKLRAVRWNQTRLELTAKAAQEYYAKLEKATV
jgi:hypothetical protein